MNVWLPASAGRTRLPLNFLRLRAPHASFLPKPEAQLLWTMERALGRPATYNLSRLRLERGTRLGPYEVLSPIGSGGMGEVWEGRDSRLDRRVAIKVSREQFSDRFDREARAVAALNHPHICTLHDVGPNYLVMEFIDGKPLAAPLPMADAFRTAIQIADALEAAHRKGITHRDLKPANVLITRSGVKEGIAIEHDEIAPRSGLSVPTSPS